MNARGIYGRHLAVLLLLALVGCGKQAELPQPEKRPSFPNLDFAALIHSDSGNAPNIVHVNSEGKISPEPIDFLEGENPYAWDVASLDQLVVSYRVDNGSNMTFGLKYYKNKTLTRNFPLGDNGILWVKLLPEKNCLLFETTNPHNPFRLGRINLGTGEEKFAEFSSSTPPIAAANLKPVWDAANKNLIIVLTHGAPAMVDGHESLARLDPDDLTIKNVVPLGNAKIDGLLFADATGRHVTAYGTIGDAPSFRFWVGSPGFIEFAMDTGKATMVMKDTKANEFRDFGLAVMDRRYVVMSKFASSPAAKDGQHTYCLDLQTQNWLPMSGGGIVNSGELGESGREPPPNQIAQQISHEGLLMTNSSANQPIAQTTTASP